MSWKTINYTKLGGQHAFEEDFLNSRTLRRFLPEVAEQQMFTQQGRAPLKNARDESAQFKVNSPQGRPQVGSQGGRRFKHPTAVKQWAHAAAGGEEEGRHQPVCYLHKHTHTHTPRHPPSWGRGGRALPSHRKSGNPGVRGATTSSHLNPLAHVSPWTGNSFPFPHSPNPPAALPASPRAHLGADAPPTNISP